MMTVEQCQTWIAALRSGKYKQCYGKLKDYCGAGHCCLGVFKEINNITEINPCAETGFLPDGIFPVDGTPQSQQHYSDLNDGDKQDHSDSKSFTAIADEVEQHLLPWLQNYWSEQ